MESKEISLKPYLIACAVQASPLVVWAINPAVFGETSTSESFLRLLMWSNVPSFIGGAIIGSLRVRKLSQAGKCLTPALIIGAAAALFQSGQTSEAAIYMILIYLVSQAPAAILGCAVGAFSAGRHESRTSRV